MPPTLTNTSLTVPACDEGTSIVALSVSKVIKPSSTSITSPTLTKTSIISTSPSSPISGTAISIISLCADTAALAGASAGAGVDSTSATVSSTASAGASSVVSSVASAVSDAACDDVISAITSPSLILSPTLTNNADNFPANGAGISIDALSVSTVTIPSSASIESPTAKQISIISTSSPPTSGTRIF